MASKVIHVGQDTCHRLAVLENAGYQVTTCVSIAELHQALADPEDVDAVLVSEGAGGAHVDAVQMARMQTIAPVILFRDTQITFAESSFDLVVPILAPPYTWLAELAQLIARCRAVRAESQALTGQSAELRRDSAALRARSAGERQRAQTEYGKKIPPPEGLIGGPGGRK